MKWIWIVLLCRSIAIGATQLEFLSDFTTKQNTVFEKTLVGGLSGIFYRDNLVWAVSDDRGQNNEPRIYSFQISLNSTFQASKNTPVKSKSDSSGNIDLRLSPNGLTFLKDHKNLNSIHLLIDAEGITPFHNGWLISSEGDYNKVPRVPPNLMYFDRNGSLSKIFNWPDKFIPNLTGKLKTGIRSNLAFEALGSSQEGDFLFAVHEAPLIQENPDWKNGDPANVHILRFKIDFENGLLNIDKDITYLTDSYRKVNSKTVVSGVSELLALGKDKILVLERASYFDSVNFLQHQTKIYEVDFKFPHEKTLVYDFKDLKKLLKTTKELDNFEGMALGPAVNNKPTLLLVSDDNFVPVENTIWLLFKLITENK